ncbi:hypothetical protein cypCar_00044987 [Cyprinus carpio]|nr:hypothetical protein cypCar_00044987 [Cyprinus carpio]
MTASILIFLLMIHGVSSAGWDVSYSPSHICALKNSSVIMSCTFTYPTGYNIKKVFWTKNPVKGKEPLDLSKYPEYKQRLQYLGDTQQNCTIRLSHVTQKDEDEYCFRFITNKADTKWIGAPGSGRFYCEAHNQHGSQRSDAVTVTVKVLYWKTSYTAIVVTLCGVVVAFIIVLLTWNKLQSKSLTNSSNDMSIISDPSLFSYVYENVVAVHSCSKTPDPKMNIPLYENVTIYENLNIVSQ